MILDLLPMVKLKNEKTERLAVINRGLLAWIEPHLDGQSCYVHMSGSSTIHVSMTPDQLDKYLRTG